MNYAALERDLLFEIKKTTRRIGIIVFFYGWCVFMASYHIVTPGALPFLQATAVLVNIGAAVYCWHVARFLDECRAEWLVMIEKLRVMRELAQSARDIMERAQQ